MNKNKKAKLDEQVESDGLNYFESLPDELVIYIFTILATCTNEKMFFDNITSLGRCSVVSKRFNALTCLVPTLLIRHANIDVLNYYCPKILDKFKHIRSLEVTHWSHVEIQTELQNNKSQNKKPRPIIRWEAAYKPHGYCLAVVSCKNVKEYSEHSQKQQILMSSPTDAMDVDFISSISDHTLDMIYLHHILVSAIKDHKDLQMVVVTDLNNRGMLTLEEDVLVQLRNCTSTNLERVLARNLCSFRGNLDVPVVKPPYIGVVMNSVCFNLVEWWEKATDDDIHKDDDNSRSISSALPFKCPEAEMLRKPVTSMMENLEDTTDRDTKVIVEILSDLKSDCNLL